ncbi:putative defense protein [Anneissia japonica]|uniref:putative defense protein n=1 Tax=Anneissia japonica TaxID=1529436 RepID=UPI001425A2B7|nr:putative defense protein [Anneissia japonica]
MFLFHLFSNNKTMSMQLATCVLVMLMGLVCGFPSGPPVGDFPSLCASMTPQHGSSSPTTGSPPFEISVSSTNFTKDNAITVTIQSPGSTTFEGLFVQARVSDADFATNSAIGTFSSFSSNTGGLTCSSNANSAWGHTSKDNRASASAQWTYSAGCDDIGPVAFRATVVVELTEYYVDIRSENLLFDRSNCQDNDDDDPDNGAGTITSSMIMIAASIICYMVLMI